MDEKRRTSRDWAYVLTVTAVACFLSYCILSTYSARADKVAITVIMLAVFPAAYLLESKWLPYLGILPSIPILYYALDYQWPLLSFPLKVYAESGLILGLASFILGYKMADGSLQKVTNFLYSLKTVFPLYLSYYLLGSFNHPYFIYSFIVFSLISWVFYMEAGI